MCGSGRDLNLSRKVTGDESYESTIQIDWTGALNQALFS